MSTANLIFLGMVVAAFATFIVTLASVSFYARGTARSGKTQHAGATSTSVDDQ